MSLSQACRLLGISRQGVYKREKYVEHRLEELKEVKQLVTEKRMLMPRLGTRKLYHLLEKDFTAKGVKLGRDGLFSFLAAEHMLILPKKSYTKTTHSKHWLYKHPNLVKDLNITEKEQLWVADITYIDTKESTAYLSLITDAYSRKIVGHHLHESLHTDGVEKALLAALKGREGKAKLIHPGGEPHSDRGLQYCSEQYQSLHRKAGITCSMTDGYDCYQNALAERINGILKEEFLVAKPKDIQQARTIIDQSVWIYNNLRPHLSLNYKTPAQLHHEKTLTFTRLGSQLIT